MHYEHINSHIRVSGIAVKVNLARIQNIPKISETSFLSPGSMLLVSATLAVIQGAWQAS